MADTSGPLSDPARGETDAPQPRSLFQSLMALFGGRSAAPASAREALRQAIRDSEPARDAETREKLPAQDRRILLAALDFGDLRVEDVMVPRADIIAVEESATLADAARIFREAQHSRLPIYRGTLDEPIGMVHVKDLIGYFLPSDEAAAPRPRTVGALSREVLFVPPSMSALDLLLRMQQKRIHLSLVIDEYGGVDGLVSIEDLIEQIVGDIDDEHDEEEIEIRPLGHGVFDVEARTDLEDVEAELGCRLASPELADEVDTIGGLVVALARRVPQKGEVVALDARIVAEIREGEPQRITRLRLRPPTAEERAAFEQDVSERRQRIDAAK